jgi:hypothetical protein
MGRRSIFAGLILLVVGSSLPAAAETLTVHGSPVPLNPHDAAQQTTGALTYMGGIELKSPHRAFGGLSGVTISADGRRIVAVSDRGNWFRARLELDESGRLTGLTDPAIFAMQDRNKVPLRGHMADAEALLQEGGGRVLVAFERVHRLWRYSLLAGLDEAEPHDYPAPPDLRQAPPNQGIEAMTRLSDGRLVLLTEDYVDSENRRRGWVSEGPRYHPIWMWVRDRFKPTDMTRLPNGDVLLLERRFTVVGGIAARLSVIRAGTIQPDAVLEPRVIATLQPPLTVDNMEGIAATPGPGVTTDIYILSDDNFKSIQRTLLLKFRMGG